MKPIIITALQHAGIKSFVIGEYHFGAVTVYGEFLTWCTNSSKLFEDPDIPDDSEGTLNHLQFGRVPFDSLTGAACLAAAAGKGRTTLVVVSLASTAAHGRASTI